MRNVLAHAGNGGRRVVPAFIATAFAQEDAAAGQAQWRSIADQLRPKLPKLTAFMGAAETDVMAYMGFPKDRWSKLHGCIGQALSAVSNLFPPFRQFPCSAQKPISSTRPAI
jgi:transposase-like protein